MTNYQVPKQATVLNQEVIASSSPQEVKELLLSLGEASAPLPPLTPGEEGEKGQVSPEVARRRAFEAWATAEAFNYYAKQANDGIASAVQKQEQEILSLWQDLRSAVLVAQAKKRREAESYLPGVGRNYQRVKA